MFSKGQYTLYITIADKSIFFILFVYLARAVSVSDYGAVTATFAFANILSSFFEFGLARYFQREAASRSGNIAEQLHSSMGFKISSFVLYGALTFIYFKYVGNVTLLQIAIIASTIFIFGISEMYSRLLYGLNEYVESFKALIASKSIVFFLMCALIFAKAPYDLLLLSLLGGAILQTLLLVRYVKTKGIHFSISLNPSILRQIMASSLPIGVGLSFVWIYDKIDVLLIQQIIGREAVSFYSVAYSLYKIPQTIAGVMLLPFFTEISGRYTAEGSLGKDELLTPALILVAFGGIMIIVYNCVPGLLLSLAYGNPYRASGWILGALSFALPGLFLNNLTGATLNAIKKERKSMNSAFFAFLLNISINILLMRWIGIAAAIIATICTEYFILCVQLLYLRNSQRIRWRKTELPTTVSG